MRLRRRKTLEQLVAAGDVDRIGELLEVGRRDVEFSGVEWVDYAEDRRLAAAKALAELNSVHAAPHLAKALEDPNPLVRLEAVRALCATLPDASLVDTISGWPESNQRTDAALVLSTGSRSDPALALACATAYMNVDRDEPLFPASFASGVMRGLSADGSEQVITEAISRIGGSDVSYQRARQLLCASGDAGAARILQLLGDPNRGSEAIELLGDIGSTVATKELIHALSDPEDDVRAAVVGALGRLKDPRSVQAILQSTMDPSFEVRQAAIVAFEGLGNVGLAWTTASGAMLAATSDFGRLTGYTPRRLGPLGGTGVTPPRELTVPENVPDAADHGTVSPDDE